MEIYDNCWKTVKDDLSRQFYHVNDDWLRDCLDYYKSEHSDATHPELLAFIISQWQLSDLREINNENGYLPKNINQQKVTTLPGTYILQVDKGYDISTSKYKQLEKIRHLANENIEINEELTAQANNYDDINKIKRNTVVPTTSTNKRVMYLHLTDGIQDIMAMEYQPINFLKDFVLPGLKIMIKGPVICRRGVILLNEKNCCEIGGEVESLLIVNATENILARALNVAENPDPYKESNPGGESPLDKKEHVLSDVLNEEVKSDDFMDTIDMEEIHKIEYLNNDNLNRNKPNTVVKNESTNSTMTSSLKKRNSIMLNELPVCFESSPAIEPMDYKLDDSDEEFFQIIDETNFNTIIDQCVQKTDNPQRSNNQYFCNVKNENEIVDENYYSNNKVVKSEMIESTSTIGQKNYLPVNKSDEKNITSNPSVPNSSDSYKIRSQELPLTGKTDTQSKNVHKSITTAVNNSKQLSIKSEVKDNNKITFYMMKKEDKSQDKNQILETLNSPSSVKRFNSIQTLLQSLSTMNNDDNNIPINVIVSGKVKTMKKLEKKNHNWYLEGCICDDSESMDVFFSSEILEKIVGLSVVEFSKRKKLIKNDPKVEHELRMALRKAEATISKLNGLLQLEIIRNQSKSKIVSIL